MENLQTLLTVVVIALTILLIIVGVQVTLMLMAARKALKKINAMLDETMLGGGFLRPERIAGFIETLRNRREKPSN